MNYVGVKEILLTTKKQTPRAELYCGKSAQTPQTPQEQVNRQNSSIN